ncbi:MAG: phosphoribosylglycinamide formyltransferase, partial [Gammaproteobacteria bacterium]|nr:phosphoribosylglycinamide formyltransferase [Gammaproteobacteria bacterium]
LAVIVLISGNGSNLQAIIDAKLDINLCGVISNRADAFGLQRAKTAGIPTTVVKLNDYPDRTLYNKALLAAVDHYQPELIVLAGFMLKLDGQILRRYRGQIINIHPALLPKYPGLNTHKKVLKNGDNEHGLSIHFVDEVLDGGPIIAQAKLALNPGETPESLQSRVQILEHQAYPLVINWFAKGRIALCQNRVKLDHAVLDETGKLLNL